jgi:hypothetical protein
MIGQERGGAEVERRGMLAERDHWHPAGPSGGSMNRLFDEKIEPRDQTYRFIRDDTRGAEVKSFVERLWSFYAPYADRSLSRSTVDP